MLSMVFSIKVFNKKSTKTDKVENNRENYIGYFLHSFDKVFEFYFRFHFTIYKHDLFELKFIHAFSHSLLFDFGRASFIFLLLKNIDINFIISPK